MRLYLAAAFAVLLSGPALAGAVVTSCEATNPSTPCDMTPGLLAEFPGTATPDKTWQLGLRGAWEIIAFNQDVDVQATQGDVYLRTADHFGNADGSPDLSAIGVVGQRLAPGEHRCISVHGSLMATSPSGKGEVAAMYAVACHRLSN